MIVGLLGRRGRRQTANRGAGSGMPVEFLLRRDRTLRFRRGGRVYGTDGRIGRLERVVVDEAAGAIRELAIRPDGVRRAVLVPVELVAMTAGGKVFLGESRERFAARAAGAPTFDKRRFAAANLRELVTNGGRNAPREPRRAVFRAGRDFVETPSVAPPSCVERSPVAALEAVG